MRRRSRNNDYASRRQGAWRVSIHIGDMVLVKIRLPGRKFCLPFKAELWTVTSIKGTMVTAARDGESVMRNVSQFKKFSISLSSGQARDRSMDNTLVSVQESADFSPASHRQTEDVVSTTAGSLRAPSDSQREPSGRSRGGQYQLRSNPGPSRCYTDFVFD
ncbi:hypothetical protein NDU88_001600 [Pleurodeles waltl]|uniref:Uncharacterized protein n=1 Tax=Pleurodeles waltl TaxID=8319 RepID=A0AAV7S975_PLEWA|nr:hypothetical protein NDU88_001600 [Pleurodeles waltl]